MRDRVFSGSRLAASFPYSASSIGDEDVAPAPQQSAEFTCPQGHAFVVPFAEGAELPGNWECRQHGVTGGRVGDKSAKPRQKPPRTHWDMLLERRSIPELETLLDDTLRGLRQRRERG
ncbi:RNA polymerase-binding protein RbpA [Umezawaea sp. Da 62-37]|uniref:RNA polymerase-binding protein RbpA n=1 Tax=Umezawaea sp. Da 62-37 TaxID=3075927 RepID=UPI0037DC6DEE